LKQSGLEWNNELNNYLIKIGFRRLFREPCLYVKKIKRKSITCILGVYVDVILIAGNKGEIILVKKQIKNKFKIKEISNVDFIIGIKFIKHTNGYFLNQKRYILEIIEKFNINNKYPIRNMKPIENKNLRSIKCNESF